MLCCAPFPMDALVLQCGGPTAVVNRSLAALARRWRERCGDGTLHGGRHGLRALTGNDWMDLSACDATWLERIAGASGMALGGGRDRLDDSALSRAVDRLRSRGVGVLFLIGGNGTMAAGRVIAVHAAAAGVPLRIVGVPKTIDNDIPCTDVCPGFPSAARFLVSAVRDVAADAASMRGYEDVVLIEAMGRHAGWLAAATLLARDGPGDAPHLVLVPEVALDEDEFLRRVAAQHAAAGIAVITVAEGLRAATGVFLTLGNPPRDLERDASGQIILGRSGGPLPHVAALVRERLGLRCRLVRPDILQRASQALVSDLDCRLASAAGAAAVDTAVDAPGGTWMIALRTDGGGWCTEPVPLDTVCGERTLPLSLLDQSDTLRALIQA